MAVIVSDSSVVSALAFEEPAAPLAEQLIGDNDLHAPTLLSYELTNVARMKFIRGVSSRELLAGRLAIALALRFHWHSVPAGEVFDLAADTGLTAYDASYLYLAMTLGLPLATFDTQLRAAAQRRVPVL